MIAQDYTASGGLNSSKGVESDMTESDAVSLTLLVHLTQSVGRRRRSTLNSDGGG